MEVSKLTDDQVKRIAQENEQLRHERLAMKEKKRTLEEGLGICRDIDSRQDLEPVGLIGTLHPGHFLIEVRQHSLIEHTPEESDSSDNEAPNTSHRDPYIPPSSPSTPSRTSRPLEKAKATQPRPPIPQTPPTSETFTSAPDASPTESYSLPGSWVTPEPYVSRAPPVPAAVSSQPPTYGASNDQPLRHRKSVSMPQVPPVPHVPRKDSQLHPMPTSDGLYSQFDPRYGTAVARNGSEAERREKRHFFGGRRAG